MEDYRKQAKIEALNKAFLGKSCGDPRCEELCAEVYDAAKSMRLDPKKAVRKTIERELCCPQAGPMQEKCRFGFGFYVDSIVLSGEDKEKEASIIHVFRTGVDECKKCQDLDGTRISPEDWASESRMKAKGFWKQKNGEYLPHPHCRCHWEKVIVVKKKARNDKLKHVPDAAVSAVESVYGPTGWGEAAGAIQAATEIATNKNIYLARIRTLLLSFHNTVLTENEYDRFSDEYEKCKSDDNIRRTIVLYKKIVKLLHERKADLSRYHVDLL